MAQVNVSKYVSSALVEEGIRQVFMIPGGYVDNFARDLVHTPGVDVIVCASEAGAAMMADGYARASYSFGVCLSISGPGASNMLTGLSLSKSDRIPILAITGDNPLAWRDRDSIQDAGSTGMQTNDLLAKVADKQYQVVEGGLVPDYTRRTMTHLASANPGPVHLAVPMDRQGVQIEDSYTPIFPAKQIRRLLDVASLDAVFQVLSEQTKVAMLIGSGVRKSQAFQQVLAFAEKFQIPVATTMGSKGDFPENHPLSLGVFGWAGSELANETLMSDELDCLLVVGSKLGQIASMSWDEALNNERKLIQIDINSENLDQTYIADLAVVGDAAASLDYLSFKQVQSDAEQDAKLDAREDWLAQVNRHRSMHYVPAKEFESIRPIHPGFAIQTLQAAAPSEPTVFVDNGAHTFFAAHYWQSYSPNHFNSAIKYSGAMGWAIPASIGAKFTHPSKLTVAIVGDGCMLMHGIEIQTAARYGLKGIVFVVMNNCAHGNPKLRLGDVSNDEHDVTSIPDHDWAMFGRSLGLAGYSVEKPEELQAVFEKCFQEDKPVIVDVKCGLYSTPTKVFDDSFMKEFNRYISD